MGSLDAGLKSLDVAISSQCAAAVDNLAGHYFKNITGGVNENGTPAAQVRLSIYGLVPHWSHPDAWNCIRGGAAHLLVLLVVPWTR